MNFDYFRLLIIPLIGFSALLAQESSVNPAPSFAALGSEVKGVAPAIPSTVEKVDLQQLIDDAIASKATSLKLPPGTYRLAPEKGALLTIQKAQSLEIDAKDVHLIGTDLAYGIEMMESSHVTIRGLTLDYDPLPFTQGVVEAIHAEEEYIDVKIDDGYPETNAYLRCGIYDPVTRKLKRGTSPTYSSSAKLLGSRRIRVAVEKQGLVNLEVGDLFVLGKYVGVPHGIRLRGCEAVTLEDCSIFSSPVMGIQEMGGVGGNIYRRIKITPGPIPAGATAARLRSTLADGIHSGNVGKGPLIENCLVEEMADDGIAIHGTYHLILESTPTGIIFASHGNPVFKEGDLIEVNTGKGEVKGQALMKSITTQVFYSSAKKQKVIKEHIWTHVQSQFKNVWKLELQTPLPAVPGDRLTNLNQSGNGFIIRNNEIKNNRARGILIKASDGLIENNHIYGSSRSAIALSPELTWCESGFCRNVIIRKNRIEEVGGEANLLGAPLAGAMTICATSSLPGKEAYSPPGGHSKIRIEDNIFERCRSVNLLITSASDVVVKGNQFKQTHEKEIEGESRFDIDPYAVIWVTESKGIQFEGNQLISPGAFTSSYLKRTPTFEGFQGDKEMEFWKSPLVVTP